MPDEHPGLAAMTTYNIVASGSEVTPESVRARLRATGRDTETLEEAA